MTIFWTKLDPANTYLTPRSPQDQFYQYPDEYAHNYAKG